MWVRGRVESVKIVEHGWLGWASGVSVGVSVRVVVKVLRTLRAPVDEGSVDGPPTCPKCSSSLLMSDSVQMATLSLIFTLSLTLTLTLALTLTLTRTRTRARTRTRTRTRTLP